jgi:hypothetical protein
MYVIISISIGGCAMLSDRIAAILKLKAKPKEKQLRLVEAVLSKKIAAKDLVDYFISASDTDKGTCADVMKNVSAEDTMLLSPFIEILLSYINYKAPRVKWGIPEAIGNMAKDYPDECAEAIPLLIENTIDAEKNTTVIKWCAAFALAEIAKHSPSTRSRLLPLFEKIIAHEKNNGVKNVYVKAIKAIEKE